MYYVSGEDIRVVTLLRLFVNNEVFVLDASDKLLEVLGVDWFI